MYSFVVGMWLDPAALGLGAASGLSGTRGLATPSLGRLDGLLEFLEHLDGVAASVARETLELTLAPSFELAEFVADFPNHPDRAPPGVTRRRLDLLFESRQISPNSARERLQIGRQIVFEAL